MKSIKVLLTTILISTAFALPTFAVSRATQETIDLWTSQAMSAGYTMLGIIGLVFVLTGLTGIAAKVGQMEKYSVPALTICLFSLIELLAVFVLLRISPVLAHLVLFGVNIFMMVFEQVMKVKLANDTKQPLLITGMGLLVIHAFVFARMLQAIIGGNS